jgi:DNA processing protein
MNITLLHLSLLSGIGPRAVEQLVQAVPYAQMEKIYMWSRQDFMFRANFSERYADLLVKGLADHKQLERELALIKKYGINWTTVDADSYPLFLKETHLPPIVLYWQGSKLAFEAGIAVVGSRKANLYGRKVIDLIVPDLVAAGCSIISGGALGADTMAHQAALAFKGRTCAIIGAGLLRPYPASNSRLFEAITAAGGAVASPFPLEMGALPGNFPARNRIISGMSRATVVIQAAEKSGARITALFALEQGREVCAVPGSIEDPLSAGCHKLLTEGASVVTSARDILEACGYQVRLTEKPVTVRQEQIVATPTIRASPRLKQDPIVAVCEVPRTFDDLLDVLEYDFSQLQERLLALQLEGVLEQDFMGRWSEAR